ncbi:MAG: TIGR03067 domain-containing protein [Planctomycetota bacterium]|nr:TIGR03067 domain-containing protein [Planctomycetota bacterium]
MKFGISLIVAIGLLFAATTVNAKESVDGTWKLTAGEANGKPLSEVDLKDGKLVIKGDHYNVTLHGQGTRTGVQKLNSDSKIHTIDITDTSGPHKGKTSHGIFQIIGDKFHVTFAPPGKPRPETLATQPETGYWSHIWERVTQ